MLTGILVPTSGKVRTCGYDPVPQRRLLAREIGVVFGQRSQLWWDLPVRDSFGILGAIHRMPTVEAATRTEELVERLGLAHLMDVPVRQLSLGGRMRGEVAAALVHRPRLLVLDEPTIGLDMISKERLRHFLLAERAEFGTTLLLTTTTWVTSSGSVIAYWSLTTVIWSSMERCRAWRHEWHCSACS
jgi:viologen exporter family transport system ATP-binding protein